MRVYLYCYLVSSYFITYLELTTSRGRVVVGEIKYPRIRLSICELGLLDLSLLGISFSASHQ